MQTVNIELLQKNVAFSLKRRKFSNTRTLPKNAVQTTAAQKRVRATKTLLESVELQAIHTALDEIYTWCMSRSMPSFFKSGIYLVRNEMVPVFNDKLTEFQTVTLPPLVDALRAVYGERKQEALFELGEWYNEADYPHESTLSQLFGVSWNYISFGVPESLPEELRAIEAGKLEKQFKDAEAEILAALREGFQEIIESLLNKLTVAPGEQPKIFRNSLFENLTEFIETFSARNMMNDVRLEEMVGRAKNILKQVRGETTTDKANAVRDDKKLRETTARALREIEKNIEVMDKPKRKFGDLED